MVTEYYIHCRADQIILELNDIHNVDSCESVTACQKEEFMPRQKNNNSIKIKTREVDRTFHFHSSGSSLELLISS